MKMSTGQIFLRGFGIIKNQLANYKKDLIILSFLGIISAILVGVLPYLLGRLFDSILLEGKDFLFFVSLWGAVTLVSYLLDWQAGIKRERLSTVAEADYLVGGFSRLLEMPLSFHKDHKIGNITHRIMRAAGALNTISGRVIIDLTPQFLSIVVGLSIALFIDYRLALFLLAGIAIYVLIMLRKLPLLTDVHTKMHQAYQISYGNAFDATINVQAVKQASAEKYEKARFYKGFRLKVVGFYMKLIVLWRGLSFYQRLLVLTTQLSIIGCSVFWIRAGQMTIGELIMFNGYAAMVFGPFFALGNFWHVVQGGMISLIQADKILSIPPENYVPDGAVLLPGIKGGVVFKDARFFYKKKQGKILDNINLEVEPGEIIALVGESGVGKTTLVDLISGFYFPVSGRVLIDGHDIKKLDLGFLRSQIAVVPQEIMLFNDTILNNIKYGKFGASEKEVQDAARLAYADRFIEKFPKKYEQVVGERGIKLSAGQKQRIAIARAVLREPKILILDEPTSSLDAESENYIRDALEKLMKGRTTFIIAHRFSTVRGADRILVLDKGKIAEQGRHEDLMRIENGIYRRLYELQIGLK